MEVIKTEKITCIEFSRHASSIAGGKKMTSKEFADRFRFSIFDSGKNKNNIVAISGHYERD